MADTALVMSAGNPARLALVVETEYERHWLITLHYDERLPVKVPDAEPGSRALWCVHG